MQVTRKCRHLTGSHLEGAVEGRKLAYTVHFTSYKLENSCILYTRGVAGSEGPVGAQGGVAGSKGSIRVQGGIAGCEGLVGVQGECGPVRGARGGTKGAWLGTRGWLGCKGAWPGPRGLWGRNRGVAMSEGPVRSQGERGPDEGLVAQTRGLWGHKKGVAGSE